MWSWAGNLRVKYEFDMNSRKMRQLMHFFLAECQWGHVVIGLWLLELFFLTINSRLCNPIQSLNFVVWEFLLLWVWICLYRWQNWIWVTHIKCASVLTSSYYIKLETTDFFFSTLVVLHKKAQNATAICTEFSNFPLKGILAQNHHGFK